MPWKASSEMEERLRFVGPDVTTTCPLHDTVGRVLAKNGRIEILINNAGVVPVGNSNANILMV
jgi:NAD(P)-dependent dehydrogenase (short-subunit alcohol dehydrogenase family)